jgi:uncharacterized membrane protein YdjX (TVP38/TMEM64 family)
VRRASTPARPPRRRALPRRQCRPLSRPRGAPAAGAADADATAPLVNRNRARPDRQPNRWGLPNRANPLKADAINARPSRRRWLIGTIVVAVAAALWGGHEVTPHLATFVEDARALGPAAPAAFVLMFVVGVVALIPASPLTIVGGAVFGFWRGLLYALVGATLGSTAAFLLGRFVARRLVARRLARMPRYAAIERAVSARGGRIMFLLRLSPVAPFNFLNYALGVTTVSITDFMVASLGMVPGTIVYAYFGKVTGEALVLAGQAELPHDTSYYAALLAGLAATVAATTVVTRTARRALRDV